MSSQTMQHTAAELRYRNVSNGIAAFEADSESRPGLWHTVTLDTVTKETTCTCRGSLTHDHCWHRAVAWAAWLQEHNRQRYQAMTEELLDAEAMSLRRHLDDAARLGQDHIAANLRGLLDLARREVCDRAKRRRDAAICLTLEISFSDLAIDPAGYRRDYQAAN